MGEDFPLDPNHVQPPQEGEPMQIEVTSHEGTVQIGEPAVEGDTSNQSSESSDLNVNDVVGHERVDDIDKARVMAEAGAGLRAMATAKSEYDLPEGSIRTRYRTRMNNFTQGAEGRNGASAKETFAREAERAEQQAGEDYEAARSSDYSKDVEKAMLMMRAEKARKTNLAEKTPAEVGQQYDIDRAEREVGKSLDEVLEASTENSHKTVTFLRYSHSIAEQYRRVGDELTPNLKALDLAYEFTGGWSHKTLQEYGHNKWVDVSFNGDKNGAIQVIKDSETWHIPIANSDPIGSNRRSPKNDSGSYEVTVSTQDPDEQFDRVQVKKVRALGETDVANLKSAFGAVRAFKAKMYEDTIWQGDDGYEEALAEVNYGRDL